MNHTQNKKSKRGFTLLMMSLLLLLLQVPAVCLRFLPPHYSYGNVALFFVAMLLIFILWWGISYKMGAFAVPIRPLSPPSIHNKSKTQQTLTRAFLYFEIVVIAVALMFGVQVLPTMVATGLGLNLPAPTSQNELQLQQLIKTYPTWAYFMVLSFAPLFEEVIFRFGIFSLFNKGKAQIFAFLTSVFVFASMHMFGSFDNILAWCTYLGSALLLAGTYAYFRNIYLNIAIHFAFNSTLFLFFIN